MASSIRTHEALALEVTARPMNREECAEAVMLLATARAFLEMRNRSMEAEQFRTSIVANIREFLDGLRM